MNTKNTIFLNIDTQKDFILPDGRLYIKDAEKIIPNLVKLTNFASKKNIKVVNTADCHDEYSKEISDKPDFINTFPKHCMIGDEGQDFIDETYPKCLHDNYHIVNWTDLNINESTFNRARNIVIFKDAFDIFEGNKLTDTVFKLLHPDKIIVYGVASDYCVNYAVLGLLKRGYKVCIVQDAIKGLSDTVMEFIYTSWWEKGATHIFTSRIISEEYQL